MQKTKYTIDQLYSSKIDVFQNKYQQCIEKYKNKIQEYEKKKLEETIEEKGILIDEKIEKYKQKIIHPENLQQFFLVICLETVFAFQSFCQLSKLRYR